MLFHRLRPIVFFTVLVLEFGVPRAQATQALHRERALLKAPSTFDNTARMDANNLDMVVTNHGSFAYDLLTGNAGLVYPKGSGKTAVFAAGPWIGAIVYPTVRVAVGEYGQEYVPGPMANGTFLPDNPAFRTYRIERGNTTSFDYLNWPVSQGAPVDQDGKPLVLGDVTLWSVYNDADPAFHFALGGRTQPLGVEVQQTTYAFSRAGALGNAIYLIFRVINKGTNVLDDAYFSFWADPDLGFFADDLIGCDTTRALGYCYNATDVDQVYGSQPPAVGFCLLRGPIVERSPGVYDTLGMTSFIKYVNGTDPSDATETYHYMEGLNKDGSPMHIEDDPGQAITTFAVTGDPVTGTGWLDQNPSDRRLAVSTGPFHMAPGDVQDIACAIVIGQGTDRLSSIADLRNEVPIVAQYRAELPPGVLPAELDVTPGVLTTKTGRAWVSAYIEIPGIDPLDIDISTVRLQGTIPAAPRIAVVGDHDSDGVPDLMLKFDRAALASLLVPGNNIVRLTGSLSTGPEFMGTDVVRLVATPVPPLTVSVSPNPLNPSGTLSFRTTRDGWAKAALYDLQGRRVRTLLDVALLTAGSHEVRIETGEGASSLSSAVYWYRVETAEGASSGSVVVVK